MIRNVEPPSCRKISEFEGWPQTDQLHYFASLLAFSIDFGIGIVRSGVAALFGAKAVHWKNLLSSRNATPDDFDTGLTLRFWYFISLYKNIK